MTGAGLCASSLRTCFETPPGRWMRMLWLAGLLLAKPAAMAQTGSTWTLRNPLPTNENLHAAAWSGSRFVVAGNAGLILVSSDGISWSMRASGVTGALHGAAFTGGQFVVVGEGGTVLTSPDGNTWTNRATSTTKTLRSVVWTGSSLVAVGDDGTAITSPSGTVWTTRFTGTSLDLLAAVWTGVKVFAVGELGITLESTTGSAWSQSSQTPALSFTGVTWDGGQLIASTSGGTLHTSPAGAAWTQRHSGAASLSSVLWTGVTAVACGSDGTLLTSPDGITWSPQGSGVDQLLLGLVQGGGTTLAVGSTGALLTSGDTVTWTDRSTVSHAMLRDIAWTGLKIVSVGLDGEVLSSADGVVWTVESSGTSDDLHGIVWAGDRLVAVGEAGAVLTSPDGVTWTPQASGVVQDLLAVAWTRDLLIATGEGGVVLTSPDGITWTPRVSGTGADLRDVVWTGAKALAVGTLGTVCVSNDGGLTWSASTTAPFAGLNGIAWSGSQFCAVGDGDVILTSANGIAWTQRQVAFGQNLLGVTWASGQFIATGTSQLILTSSNGSVWKKRGASSVQLPSLHAIRGFGSLLVSVGDGGDILTSGSSPVLTPVVNFALTSQTVAENAGVLTLGLQLSFAPAVSTSIPFTLSGTTSTGADYTISTTPVAFAAGQSAKNISINVKDDVLVEASETVIVSLGTPAGALVGTAHRFTLTVTDNDIAPVITLQPVSQLVAVNAPITTFNTAATGSPPVTFQWKKNGGTLPGATGSAYSVLNAQLSQAGKYTVMATNPTGKDTSGIAELGVVDTSPGAAQVPVGGTVFFTLSTAGNGLAYQWRKNGSPLSNGPRINGATAAKLTISSLVIGDTDTYDCVVTGPGGVLAGGPRTLTVLLPPVVNAVPPPPTMVGSDYSHTLSASNMPVKFNVIGLPKGLSLNSSTGLISGRPQASGTFNLQITASNAAGTSLVWLGTLVVQAIPSGAVGSFQAMVGRDASVNDSLGGRLEFTTTSLGACSGKLTLGKNTYSFSSRLGTAYATSPQFSVSIPRPALPDAEIDFTLNPALQTISGTIGTGGPAAPLNGWRQVWNNSTRPASDLVGYYSIGLDVQGGDVGNSAIPQGTGFLTCSVAIDGRLTFTGKTADGTSVTTATFLGPNGESLLYQTVYSHTGSVLGTLLLTPDGAAAFNDNTFTGTVSWLRKPQPVTARSYQAGFGPVSLAAYGKYLAPDSKGVILGLPASTGTAQLLFASGGVEASAINPDVTAFTYTDTFSVDMPSPGSPQNPGKATLTIEKSTGLVGGRFVLVDLAGTVVRNVRFEGMIIRPASGTRKAFGFFNLPQLPNPNTSAILSGQVVIDQP